MRVLCRSVVTAILRVFGQWRNWLRPTPKRQKNDELLRISEERLRLSLKASRQGLYDLDVATGKIVFSPEYALMLGYDPATFTDSVQEVHHRIHPEDRQRVVTLWEQCRSGRVTEFEVEFRQRTRNGDWLWTLSLGNVLSRDADGKPQRILGTHANIHDRKLAETDLQLSKRRLQQAQSIAQLGNWEMDLSTQNLWWSDEVYRIFGLDPTEFKNDYEAFLNLVHLADREKFNQAFQQAKITHTPFQLIHRLSLRDGTTKFVEQRCETEFASDGRPLIFRGTVQDVTQRVEAQMALTETEDRFLQCVTSINCVYWMCLMPDEEVLYLSPVFEKVFGMKPEALKSNFRIWLDFVHPEDKPRVQNGYGNFVRHPESDRKSEFRIVRRNGEIRWLSVFGISVRDAGHGKFHVAGIVEDITDRKNLEQQLLQAQKLQALGQLASGIAHDFNNILLLVSICSEQLLKNLSSSDPNRDTVLAIYQAGQRAAGLTHQLLLFSRKQAPQTVAVEMVAWLDRAEAMIRRVIRQNVTLTLQRSSSLSTVKADPNQLDQVLLNLILNSQDAMPHGGRITLGVTRIENGSAMGLQPSPHVKLSITDTGCGMNDELMSHIFEPYFTTKEEGKGTGLGLALAQGVIRQLGGDIRVQSQVGVGTTFEIYLPASTERADSPESPQPSLVSSETTPGNETILLVEDESSILHSLTRMLEHHGYNVLTANQGPAAIVAALRQPRKVELLLTDIMLPDINGFELANILRENDQDLPVIFMSGIANEQFLARQKTSPKDEFIQKPFESARLLSLIRKLLSERASSQHA